MRILSKIRSVIGQPQAEEPYILLNQSSVIEKVVAEQWESTQFGLQRRNYKEDLPFLAALAFAVVESEKKITAEWAMEELGGLHRFSGRIQSLFWGDTMARQGQCRYARLLELCWITTKSGQVEFQEKLLLHFLAAKHYTTFWLDKDNQRMFNPDGSHFGKWDGMFRGYIGQLATSRPGKCLEVFRGYLKKDPHFALGCLINGFPHDVDEVISGLLDSITWQKEEPYLAAAANLVKTLGVRSANSFEKVLLDDNKYPCALLFAAQVLGEVGTSDQISRLLPVLENSELGNHEVRVLSEKINKLEAEKMSDEEYKNLKAAKSFGTLLNTTTRVIFHTPANQGTLGPIHQLQITIYRQDQIRRELAELEAKKQEELARRNAILPQIHTALQKSFAQMAGRAPVLQPK